MPLEEAMKAAIKYCIEHGVLSKFLEERSSEVINMLLTEWNWTDATEVWQQEARAEARAEGHAEGHAEGRTEGRTEERREIAKNALAKGYAVQTIQELTGLDPETIKNLS
jgi:predicted transposase/invertase (TIGR01784 family)